MIKYVSKNRLVMVIILLFLGVGVLPNISGNIERIKIISSKEDICLNTLSSNLLAWWNFDEGSGNVAHDYSGNENHGVIHGAS